MKKFHYVKYTDKYETYFSLFKQDKESQKLVHLNKEYSYLIFMNQEFIGLFSLMPFYGSKIEIRRWILPKYRNQGLGTQIAQDISDFAFLVFPQCTEIISNIDYQNIASKISIQKAGFILDQLEYNKRQDIGEGYYYEPYVKKKV